MQVKRRVIVFCLCVQTSHILEFEAAFITPHNRFDVVHRAELMRTLGVEADAADCSQKIEAFLMELFSKKESLSLDSHAHIVMNIHVQTHKLQETQITNSTMTFIHVHPSPQGTSLMDKLSVFKCMLLGRWMDEQVELVGSALMDISSKKGTHSTAYDSLLLQEILKQNGRPKVYTLFMEIMNAPGCQKEDVEALTLCSKIVSSRMVRILDILSKQEIQGVSVRLMKRLLQDAQRHTAWRRK